MILLKIKKFCDFHCIYWDESGRISRPCHKDPAGGTERSPRCQIRLWRPTWRIIKNKQTMEPSLWAELRREKCWTSWDMYWIPESQVSCSSSQTDKQRRFNACFIQILSHDKKMKEWSSKLCHSVFFPFQQVFACQFIFSLWGFPLIQSHAADLQSESLPVQMMM